MKRTYPKSSLKTLLAQLAAIEAGAELGLAMTGGKWGKYGHSIAVLNNNIRTCLKAHFGCKLTERNFYKLSVQLSATLKSLGGGE